MPWLSDGIGYGCLVLQCTFRPLKFIGCWIIFILRVTKLLMLTLNMCRSRGRKIKGHLKFIQWCLFIFCKANYILAPCWVSFSPAYYFPKRECTWQSKNHTSLNTDGRDYTTLSLDLQNMLFPFKVSVFRQLGWLLSINIISSFFPPYDQLCVLWNMFQNNSSIQRMRGRSLK